MDSSDPLHAAILFRGRKIDFPVSAETKVGDVKHQLVSVSKENSLLPRDIKIVLKGRILHDDDENMHTALLETGNKKVYKLVASGMSEEEAHKFQTTLAAKTRNAPRVRDDLSEAGRLELELKRRLGQRQMLNAAKKVATEQQYGFGRIETLPNLPEEAKARAILQTLANDPGVLACMAKHEWNVGALSELYPEGNVGQSAVCVMGLNENKGQRIRLRLRTDDLTGFRKILSIRKVLYHELAHNVHSEHDDKFFQLMRQVERECLEMDWTHGEGISPTPSIAPAYMGGTHRLGGQVSQIPVRELAAQAAMARMTPEEEEIQANCGCGRNDMFLPHSNPTK